MSENPQNTSAVTTKKTLAAILAENAEMKADIQTFIQVVQSAFDSLGINMNEMKGDVLTILMQNLPKIMASSGSNEAFARLNELAPIIEKYKVV